MQPRASTSRAASIAWQTLGRREAIPVRTSPWTLPRCAGSSTRDCAASSSPCKASNPRKVVPMRRPDRVATALLSLALGGCASTALELAPPRPDRPWAPATDAGGEIVPGRTDVAGADYVLPSNRAAAALAPPPALDPDRTYTLAELIDIAQ